MLTPCLPVATPVLPSPSPEAAHGQAWLQSVQNAAARLIFRARRYDHVVVSCGAYTGFGFLNGSRSGWQC